ncbi:MAG TPA: hypothetical protein VM756_02885 [Burkholderiales bacterium]|jgi:hypothetical protein|nr:hypothetical protein [Burkholderiales bacterium]
MTVRIAALAAADHSRWLELARGYEAFYKTAVTEARQGCEIQQLHPL